MLALTGCTGKIGNAVLHALLENNLIPPSHIVICTSSAPSSAQFTTLREQGIQIRYSNYSSAPSMQAAFAGCSKLLLVSTPAIALDFNDAPDGHGREGQHIRAIEAAREAGVKHVFYTSLAFGGESEAGVMRAHLRTESFLARVAAGAEETGAGMKYTVLRMGLYSESWPLYLGYFDTARDGGGDGREEVLVAGDGKVAWTAIKDLGLAAALVVAEKGETYVGRTIYLSALRSRTLEEVAATVSTVRGREVRVRIVGREEFVRHYVESGRERAAVEWWVSTYEALRRGECDVKDRTFSELLAARGVEPKLVEETIREMLTKG